jgi:hypothetical protein
VRVTPPSEPGARSWRRVVEGGVNDTPSLFLRLALVFGSVAVVACGGDDDSDDGDDAADSSTDPTAGDGSTAPNDDAAPGDDDDGDGNGDPTGSDPTGSDPTGSDPTGSGGSCGAVPQICVEFVDHLIECDPANEALADDAENECACGVAMYPDTPECQSAVDAYFACASTFPCDMPEACLDAALAMAGACGG